MTSEKLHIFRRPTIARNFILYLKDTSVGTTSEVRRETMLALLKTN